MKLFRLPLLLTLGFALVSGIAMWVGARAAGRWEGYLQKQPGFWEPDWLQQGGWRLCLPSFIAVEAIPRYSCTPTWHPAYRAGLVFLWVGYTGGFWMISVVGGSAIRRRFGMPFPSWVVARNLRAFTLTISAPQRFVTTSFYAHPSPPQPSHAGDPITGP